MTDIYKRYEELLAAKGATSYQVAKATGMATATFSQWKKGKYTPKQDKLQRIADYFGVSLEYLMTGKDANNNMLTEETAKLLVKVLQDSTLAELINIYYELPANRKSDICKIAKLFREEK